MLYSLCHLKGKYSFEYSSEREIFPFRNLIGHIGEFPVCILFVADFGCLGQASKRNTDTEDLSLLAEMFDLGKTVCLYHGGNQRVI